MKMNTDKDWLMAKAEAEDGMDCAVVADMVGYPTAQQIAEKQSAWQAQIKGGIGAALVRSKVNCRDCFYWEAASYVTEIQPAVIKNQFSEGSHRSAVSVPTVGMCRRRSASSGWPSTYPNDWCGEGERR